MHLTSRGISVCFKYKMKFKNELLRILDSRCLQLLLYKKKAKIIRKKENDIKKKKTKFCSKMVAKFCAVENSIYILKKM